MLEIFTEAQTLFSQMPELQALNFLMPFLDDMISGFLNQKPGECKMLCYTASDFFIMFVRPAFV